MSRRKRKIEYIDGDGNEHILEGSTLDLSKGSLEDLIVEAIDAESDDKIIKEKSQEIKKFISKISDKKDKLKHRYELGGMLQFVDSLKLNSEEDKKAAFERLVIDLRTTSKWNPSTEKALRSPRHMYALYTIPEKIVFTNGMTWHRWFNILEYKSIVNNIEVLKELVHSCTRENWNESTLRKKVQKLNKQLTGKNE